MKGFSLISTVFILVILGLAGTFVVNMVAFSSATTNFATLGRRAYFAAISGSEWGIHQAVDKNSCVASTTLNLTQSALSGFAVTVSCSENSYTEGVTTYQVFKITAVSSNGNVGDVDYASRTVEVKATRGV